MPTPTGPSSSNDTMDMQNMVMQMSFFWGKDVTVLFHGWPDNHLGMYTPFLGGLIHSSIKAVRVALSYSVMSFNVEIFIAAVAGQFCGYFIVKYQ
ncbi:hypothetical protein LIER_30275 [Lithospermum erythrorhizon]|uniref:Copper transporter n=1 Tax=Lithospermum erythrorhizon TaxID=34254 RepID=A0AAV3RM46_LITER